MDARSHHATPRKREIRAAKEGSARDAIGTLQPGHEVFCLSFGQFSLIDALVALLEQTGPAHVVVSTWTAANAHLEKAASLLGNAEVLSMRFLVDRSFLTRQPEYCATMRRLFGDDCIRTCRTHCKFMLVRNDRWNLAVRTSMNLNENERLENLEISDDPAFADFLEAVADDMFREQAAGEFNGLLPELESIANVDRRGTVRTGAVAKGLTFPRLGPW